MANNSFEYAKSSIRCSAINTVRFIRKQNTEAKYEAELTTTSGENLTMTVGYTYGNASSKEPGWRTISVKEGALLLISANRANGSLMATSRGVFRA